ncbi:hypothetical protein D3C78_1619550 [compost metagenome]
MFAVVFLKVSANFVLMSVIALTPYSVVPSDTDPDAIPSHDEVDVLYLFKGCFAAIYNFHSLKSYHFEHYTC